MNLYVGPEESLFTVHKSLLCHYSDFFRGAFLNDVFEEAKEGVVRLKEEDCRTYTGSGPQ